jgi:hypothetical protein
MGHVSIDQVFPGIDSFLVIGTDGQIGRFEPDYGFRVFDKLTAALADFAGRLLELHRETPDSPEVRPAIVLPPLASRKWRSATLVFDRLVVHRLFPSSTGSRPGTTTPFQARNRVRSIYQGMELLIVYENKAMPGMAFYCPILLGDVKSLHNYPDYQEFLGHEAPGSNPAIEVLNFLAPLSPSERKSEKARELVRLVRGIGIERSRRADSPLRIEE